MSKKVLIIRLGAIGDVVETTGLISALHNAGFEVDYLTGKVPAQILSEHEKINNVFILEKKNYSYIFKTGFKLKKSKYDAVINLQPSLRLKTLAFLTGAKKISNYKKSYKFHAVENFFETAKNIFPELELEKNICLNINENTKNKIRTMLNDTKLKICFNTGANSSRQGRKWNIENWIELAGHILNNYNAELFVVGSSEDKDNADKLIEKFPQIKSFAGKTTLMETAALLDSADIVISGDTGPLHIASATSTTCIGLYGCCSVSRSGPYGTKHYAISSTLSCSPCDKRKCKYINSDIDDAPCMRDIKPQKVLNLVDMIINKK